MPKVIKASEARIKKTIMIAPETDALLEKLKKEKGLSQGKAIDIAIKYLQEKEQI
ncbi:TPA: hypothetical protein ACOQ39_006094 [Bacillus cereus]|uniref:hypothetical protein n=1 Tax=Bacteria TaxID=2 RepID=UPI000AF6C508|nr:MULTISPECIES: hypothetical protein [Bacillus cereus group]HDR7946176.1 hypothetical protein [Bacillus wiedmannii]HDR8294864.1 hypothetical protein [Bacillus cereus]MCC2375839.1 hypothetical protein [Bacillus paranthracis]HDR7244838.1 hypothetical protein [Bacillus mobilis]HDR8312406.1 hypothetical protein [Bacillus cereus]